MDSRSECELLECATCGRYRPRYTIANAANENAAVCFAHARLACSLTDSLRRIARQHGIVQAEVMMIRLLFVLALAACSATPKPVAAPTTSTSELAVHRAQLISWLHDYRVRGIYPSDGTRPISVFVDARGVRCPMAEMIHLSGRDDLVEAVHRDNNALRLADVHSGPLYDWMLGSGLTQEEVVLVQGAMTVQEMRWMNNDAQSASQLAIANVTGKLEMAEAALRSATPTSLAIAAQRLRETHRDQIASAR